MSLTVTTTPFSGGVTAYNNPTARGVANYLYWLCGKFQIEGQYIIMGVGGGSVIPINPTTFPNPIEFEVTGSSFIINVNAIILCIAIVNLPL
jgi:hypothetical protein